MISRSENSVYILCVETANSITSVAVSRNGDCLHSIEVLEPNKAADVLHVLIEQLLSEAHLSFKDLNAIAISAGPGSYTGLRIAAAAAKGYCFSLDIPLIAIPTLQAMVNGVQTRYHQTNFDEFMPMIDARRMEVFTSIYAKNQTAIQVFPSLIIDEEFQKLFFPDKKYLLFGNGAFKAKFNTIVDTIVVMKDFVPSSKDLCLLAFSAYTTQNFNDIAYFEPSYTKAFYTTAAK